MNENIDIHKLWEKQTTTKPNVTDLIDKANQIRNYNLIKLIFKNTIFVIASVIMISLWINYQPKLLSTKAGIVFIILAMLIYVFASTKSIFSLFNKINIDINSKDYLNQMLSMQTKYQTTQKIISDIYFILFSVGIFLYFYEYTLNQSLSKSICTYLAILALIIWGRFYMKSRLIKKQQTKIKDIISKLKHINKQFD